MSVAPEGLELPDAVLDGYAFAERIGKRGPFVSERVRAGICAWNAGIDYPRHRHRAEEIDLPLAGSARFAPGAAAPFERRAGDLVQVPADTPHGIASDDELPVLFYPWQAGDLRLISSFA